MCLLNGRHEAGEIDHLIVSAENLSKCPMMRRMFAEIDTPYIWWFDDDSHITESSALTHWLHAATSSPASTVIRGSLACCGHPAAFADMDDALGFVRSASWYRGLPPPSWRVGGGGEFNFQGLDLGNGRWIFILGGCFMIRTSAVRALDWPDSRLFRSGDDVFLGEAIRQQGSDRLDQHKEGSKCDEVRLPDPAAGMRVQSSLRHCGRVKCRVLDHQLRRRGGLPAPAK